MYLEELNLKISKMENEEEIMFFTFQKLLRHNQKKEEILLKLKKKNKNNLLFIKMIKEKLANKDLKNSLSSLYLTEKELKDYFFSLNNKNKIHLEIFKIFIKMESKDRFFDIYDSKILFMDFFDRVFSYNNFFKKQMFNFLNKKNNDLKEFLNKNNFEKRIQETNFERNYKENYLKIISDENIDFFDFNFEIEKNTENLIKEFIFEKISFIIDFLDHIKMINLENLKKIENEKIFNFQKIKTNFNKFGFDINILQYELILSSILKKNKEIEKRDYFFFSEFKILLSNFIGFDQFKTEDSNLKMFLFNFSEIDSILTKNLSTT